MEKDKIIKFRDKFGKIKPGSYIGLWTHAHSKKGDIEVLVKHTETLSFITIINKSQILPGE